MRISPTFRLAILLAGAVLTAGYIGLRQFTNSICSLDVIRRMPSPDGRFEAVLFQRNCGATTNFATNLSITRSGSTISNAPGNLLVADSDHGRAPLDSGYVVRVTVRWVTPDSVIVHYDSRAHVYKQSMRAHGVSVAYQ